MDYSSCESEDETPRAVPNVTTRGQLQLQRLIEGIAADCAADEAIAADACRAAIPAGARCYICLEGRDWEAGELVRQCACRGADAGFIHIRCLVKWANNQAIDDDYDEALTDCRQYRQPFVGAGQVALTRARWQGHAALPDTNGFRQVVLSYLAQNLGDAGRFDESLACHEAVLATNRRVHGPNNPLVIEAEELVAMAISKRGMVTGTSRENMQYALRTLTRIYAWKVRRYGRDDKSTLWSASNLASVQASMGMLPAAISLLRSVILACSPARVFGPEHPETLQNNMVLVGMLVGNGELDEARALHAEILPVFTRVFGPEHTLTRRLNEYIRGDFNNRG